MAVTLAQLAVAKHHSEDYLRSLGVDDRRGWVLIPYGDVDGNCSWIRQRQRTNVVAKDGSKWVGAETDRIVPYGLWLGNTDKKIWLVEGETNCWAAWAHGVECLGIPGAGMQGKLDLEHVTHASTIYISQDPGVSGVAFVVGLVKRLGEIGWRGQVFSVQIEKAGVKDLADLHCRDRDRFCGSLAEIVRQYAQRERLPGDASDCSVGNRIFSAKTDRNGNGNSAEPDEPVIESRWPAPLRPEAYHGVAGEFVRRVAPQSEADPAAILVQLLVSFGSAVGRGVHFKIGPTEHHCNDFAMLVGHTGISKKGTSWGWVHWLMRQIDEHWASSCVLNGVSSGQGVIKRIQDTAGEQVGCDDKRLLVNCEEGSRLFKSAKQDGSVLSEILRQLWDRDTIDDPTKHTPSRVTGAHASCIAHITPTELYSLVDRVSCENGLLNRFLLIACRRTQLLSEGGSVPHLRGTISQFEKALAFAKDRAAAGVIVERDAESRELWGGEDGYYFQLETPRAGAVRPLVCRASTHLLRIALIYSMLDRSSTIRAEHLRAAKAIVDYSEATARWLFAREGESEADRVYSAILAAKKQGVNRTDLLLKERRLDAKRLTKILQKLTDDGLVIPGAKAVHGRPAVPWVASIYAQFQNAESAEEVTSDTVDGSF